MCLRRENKCVWLCSDVFSPTVRACAVAGCKALRRKERLRLRALRNFQRKTKRRTDTLFNSQTHTRRFPSVITFTAGWITSSSLFFSPLFVSVYLHVFLFPFFLSSALVCFSCSHVMNSIPQWATMKSNTWSAGDSFIPQYRHSSLHQSLHCLWRLDQREH